MAVLQPCGSFAAVGTPRRWCLCPELCLCNERAPPAAHSRCCFDDLCRIDKLTELDLAAAHSRCCFDDLCRIDKQAELGLCLP